MVLTTHAVTGATLATLVPNSPVLGFVIGFGSHFVLDSIPHWDYSLRSRRKDNKNPLNTDLVIGKDFLFDLFKIGFDGVLGLVLAFLFLAVFSQHSLIAILCGVIGGMLPDALQFVYFKWKREPLITLQKFHIWSHANFRIKEPISGVLFQIIVIVLFVFILK